MPCETMQTKLRLDINVVLWEKLSQVWKQYYAEKISHILRDWNFAALYRQS